MDKKTVQALKARAHSLKPVVMIGEKGLTDAVLAETNIALDSHELIKIKITGHEREDKQAIAQELCHELDAQLIQKIGNIIVVYRLNLEK